MTTILIADDCPNIREFCRQELEEEGYLVLVARGGSEAIGLTDRYVPDLVILDVVMPGVDGLDALASIRRRHPQIPAILFTSFDDICLHDPRATQAAACVKKSHDLSELRRAIEGVVRSRHHQCPYRVGLPPKSFETHATV